MLSKRQSFYLWAVVTALSLGFAATGHASPARKTRARATAASHPKALVNRQVRREFLRRAASLAAIGTGATLGRQSRAQSEGRSQKSANRNGFKSSGKDRRIVTTTPSGTELVDALGQSHTLVGVDDYTTYPNLTRELPRVGTVVNPDVGAIAALDPALVVLDAEQVRASNELQRRGVDTLVVKMESINDVDAALEKLGRTLGKTEHAARARALMDSARHAHRGDKARQRVLVVLERPTGFVDDLIVAGPASHIGELLESAGFENAIPERASSYPKLSPAEMDRVQPTLVLDLSQGGESNLADWQRDSRFKRAKIRALTLNHLLAPTSRLEQSIAELRNLE